MFRRDLVALLQDNAMSITQIARLVRETPRQVASDVEHLRKSLKHSKEYRMEIIPASCRKCRFEFDATTLTKPSKCPACYSTWLHEPRIVIHARPGTG